MMTPRKNTLQILAQVDEACSSRRMSPDDALEFLFELADALAGRIDRVRPIDDPEEALSLGGFRRRVRR